MSYTTYYSINYHNHLNNELLIHIQRKDGMAISPEFLTATELKINSEADGDGLYSSIIRNNIELVLNLTDDDSVTWETFFDQVHDEWRIVITNDNQAIFTGFMLPDEGSVPFEDKPYDLTIRAVDGLSLLKNVPLKQPDGTNFKGKFTLIEFVSACLFWTGLELPIKIYSDIFESSFDDRGTDISNDAFAQAKLDHRTFMSSATEFVSCYEALEIIFKEHFRMFQDYDLTTDQQVWCIYRIPQYQYTPAPIVYYTIYDFDGTNPVGYEDPENFGLIGKSNLIYKTNEVTRSGKFAAKSARTEFKYISWPELPLNNKFERGTLVPLLSGVNYSSYTIDDWTYGRYRNQPAINSALPAVPATTAQAYRKSTFNMFGIEIQREVVLEGVPDPGGSPPGFGILMSSEIPVNMGDYIKINYEWKANYSATGPGTIAMIFVKTASGTKYFIDGYTNLDTSPLRWRLDTGNVFVRNMFNANLNEYSTISIEPPTIPVDGDLYIGILASAYTGFSFYMKSFNVEYTPMVAGGYIPVKGDYWVRTQSANYIDAITEEVRVSDSLPRAIKGNLLRDNGVTATTPTWYRYGLVETRHYKELVNIGRFNTAYRRFFKFDGTFTSTKFSPENDLTQVQPLSFRKTYRFEDLPELPECVLVPPLTIDYKTGWITATFEEVRRESATPIMETLEAFINRVILAINNTTEADWVSGSGSTPASGTVAFPPVASLAGVPNTINIGINEADSMGAVVTVGGAGNSPSITETYNADVGTYRIQQFEFGTDIAIGNTFTFSAYGHDVSVTVQAVAGASSDGRQLGDTATFNYLFE